MKLDITKTNIKCNNYSGLPLEIQFLKAIKEGHSCLRLLNPLTQCYLRSETTIEPDLSLALSKVKNENDAI